MTKEKGNFIPGWKKWLIAARPWALPASAIPVTLGTLLAVTVGGSQFSFLRFLLALVSMILLHFAANMLSDVYDYRLGLDREVTPVSGAVVRQWLSAEAVQKGAWVLFGLGSILGLILVFMTTPWLFFIGLVGVIIGANYRFLKPKALGDFAVFFNFGILGSMGAWMVQTKSFSLWPGIWAIPQGMLVVAILHANNWRDAISDREKDVITVASLLGDKNSFIYYGSLLFAPFILSIAYVFGPRLISLPIPPLPFSFLLVLFSLPLAFSLWRRAKNRHAPRAPLDFIILDGATSQFNWVFGLFSLFGLGLHLLIR